MMKPIYAAFLVAATGALVACSGGPEESAPVENARLAGLEASNARLILPAVSGNPAAVYFDLANGGERNVAVREAAVAGAGSTQLHGTMEQGGEMTMGETGPQVVRAGQTLKFEPGALHVMAFDLAPEVKEGGTVEVTLTVAGGDTMSFPATVQAAGDDR